MWVVVETIGYGTLTLVWFLAQIYSSLHLVSLSFQLRQLSPQPVAYSSGRECIAESIEMDSSRCGHCGCVVLEYHHPLMIHYIMT